MYFYIYDKFTQKNKYSKKLSQINIKLSNIGIYDEKTQVSPLRPIEVIVKEALQDKRYTNIIVIGDDKIASQVINIIAHSGKRVTFGMIPMRESIIAESLGMPKDNIELCCKELLARKVAKIDLGKAGDHYFLTSAIIEAFPDEKIGSVFKRILKKNPSPIYLDFKEGFSIASEVEKYSIINIPTASDLKDLELEKIKNETNPYDGLLEVVIFEDQKRREGPQKSSLFKTSRMDMESNSKIHLKVDGQQIKKSLLKFEVAHRSFNVLVGKNRVF